MLEIEMQKQSSKGFVAHKPPVCTGKSGYMPIVPSGRKGKGP